MGPRLLGLDSPQRAAGVNPRRSVLTSVQSPQRFLGQTRLCSGRGSSRRAPSSVIEHEESDVPRRKAGMKDGGGTLRSPRSAWRRPPSVTGARNQTASTGRFCSRRFLPFSTNTRLPSWQEPALIGRPPAGCGLGRAPQDWVSVVWRGVRTWEAMLRGRQGCDSLAAPRPEASSPTWVRVAKLFPVLTPGRLEGPQVPRPGVCSPRGRTPPSLGR